MVVLASAAAGCAPDFTTNRNVPPRGTLGEELFIGLCDRVGANALPEDVTGYSWHAVCHPDAKGHYATKVDQARLVPLDPNARDVNGDPVPLATQQADRAYRVARIEALAHDHDEVVRAFDAAFPDVTIPVRDLSAADPSQSCTMSGTGSLHTELANVLGRMVSLYDDDTVPLFTEALGRLMNNFKASPDAQQALAHFDAREGYRPLDVAMGAGRPVLSYPKFVPLVRSLLSLLATDSDPYNPAGIIDPSKPLGPGNRKAIPGKDAAQMQQLLEVGRDEMRAPSTMPLPLLTSSTDPQIPSRALLSRPRTTLEMTRQIMLTTDPAFDVGLTTPRYVVGRDPRAYAAVPLVNGAVPFPFVDMDGDLLPDVDGLGQFVVQSGQTATSPFFSPDGVDGPRDANGLATGSVTPTLYAYLNVGQTFVAALEKDLVPLVDPDPTHGHETLMNVLGGAYALFGNRDANAASTRQYPPDPESETPTAPVVLSYNAFHPETSPLQDLAYAFGVLLADPAMDDLNQLGRQLMSQHPQAFARLVGLGLQIKSIANAHPEAKIPQNSTLWDEMLDVVAQIAHQQDSVGAGGVLEDLILSFADDRTAKLQQAFGAYIGNCDTLTYNHNSTDCSNYQDTTTCLLNGAPWNNVSMDTSQLHVACDHTQPDVGTNRSALQIFMQALHDIRGMSACTKAGAVAHIQLNLNQVSSIFPNTAIPIDYPTSSAVGLLCPFLGAPAPPNPMPECGILRIKDVGAMLLDVVLGRAQFDIRDPCLLALLHSSLTGLVGGADAFLQSQADIVGFDTHPTVPGVSRLFYFDIPYMGSMGDPNPATTTTKNFVSGLIDPPSTTACTPTPFTDTDGTLLNLYDCTSTPQYSLPQRDKGATFPLELYGFATNVQPLAAAFDDHGQPALFVDLFNTLHMHWGSTAQTPDICDPTLPKTDTRWCSQDGAVTYEPLLYDVLTNTDVLQALHDTIPIIQNTTVTHCDKQDPVTHACAQTSTRNGIQVLAQLVRVMVDPAQNKGLTDRNGVQTAPRNDGTTNPQVTPIYLLIDALKGIDSAFASWANAHPGDDRQPPWRAARSQLVDEFFSVNGSGAAATWANPAIPAIVPPLLDALESQVLAQCPDRSSRAACSYWTKQMPQNLADVVGGPTFAAVMDLVEAIRTDDGTRQQLEQLLTYLLDQSTPDATAATMTASIDILQILNDDPDLQPFYNAAADVFGAQVLDASGNLSRRGLADAAINVLAHVFAAAYDAQKNEVCAQEIDPNQAIASILTNLVTPIDTTTSPPVEVLMDVAADVNRLHPGATTKLDGGDYGNIANEISEFCLDPTRGLEQVYKVVKEATMSGGVLSE